MQTTHFDAYREKYQDTHLKIDNYLIRRMGLIANQTTLRMGDYHMQGALAMVSFGGAQVLAVLSPNEIAHFSRFVGKPASLILAFDRPGIKEPVRYHLRITMSAITPIPNRSNICLVQLQFKLIPPEFMSLLCDLLDDLSARREAYDTKCEDMLEIDPKDFHVAAIKPRGEFFLGTNRIMVDINAVSLCRIRLTIPSWTFPADTAADTHFNIKLVGIAGSFVISGTFEGELPMQGGTHELKVDFSNELIDNSEEWQTRISIRARAAKPNT